MLTIVIPYYHIWACKIHFFKWKHILMKQIIENSFGWVRNVGFDQIPRVSYKDNNDKAQFNL